MGRDRYSQIGLDRIVRLEWVEMAADAAMAEPNRDAVRGVLRERLRSAFGSGRTDVRGTFEKTTGILAQVWARSPGELAPLREDGLRLLAEAPDAAQTVVHWGMLGAVYPFWFAVATQVGRLLRLQGSVVAAQVQRRVREQYGERETVARRCRYVLRSFVDWGVLRERERTGIYVAAEEPIAVDSPRVIAWFVEAGLNARPDAVARLDDLLAGPSCFPFRFALVHPSDLAPASSRLDIVRSGFDDNLVTLRKV